MTYKILVYMSGEKGHVFFGAMKFLKEKINAEYYVIIDRSSTTKDFFLKQNIVNFKKIYFYRDLINEIHQPDLNYLHQCEMRYKINIWMTAYADPYFYNNDQEAKFGNTEILSFIENDCRLFEKIIQEVNPDFLIIHVGGQKQLNLLDGMAKESGVKILKFAPAKFGARYQISENYDLLDKYDDQHASKNADDEYLLHMKKELDLSTYYSKKIPKSSHLQKKNYMMNVLTNYFQLKKSFKEIYGNKKSDFFKAQTKLLSQNIQRRQRKKFLDNYAIKEIEDEKFVYFPLHMQPEMTISVCAPFYTDQINVIRNIAKSLPINYILYVKEHNSMGIFYNWRDTSYYKKIIEMPNVKLVHPSIASSILLEKCSLAITINGSTSYEALFYKKPVIVFADTNSMSIPYVTRVRNMEDLPVIIRRLLNNTDHTVDKRYFEDKMSESFYFDLSIFDDTFDTFYKNGVMIEDITQEKMTEFIKRNEKLLEYLADKFAQKIHFHTKSRITN